MQGEKYFQLNKVFNKSLFCQICSVRVYSVSALKHKLTVNLPYRVTGPCRLSIFVNVSKVDPKHVIM